MKKRMTSIILALCLALALLPVSALAEEEGGSCGEGVTWRYDEADRTLAVTGEGAMEAAAFPEAVMAAAEALAVEEGVTAVPAAAFAGWAKLSAVSLPASLASIGEGAFAGCPLQSVSFGGSAEDWAQISAPISLPEGAVVHYRSGSCGNSAVWAFAGGVLTIGGSGEVTGGYSEDNPAPWAEYAGELESVLVEGSIVKLDAGAFAADTLIHYLGSEGGLTAEGLTVHCVTEDNAIPADCVTPGITAGIACQECQKILTGKEEIPARGHTEAVVPAVAATCGAPGYTEGKKCSVCGTVLEAPVEIPATGEHTLGETGTDGNILKEPTCTEAGTKEVEYRCTVCQASVTREEEIPAKGHTPETIPGKPATCTDDGLTEGSKCADCQELLTAQEEIPALGHDWQGEVSEADSTEATCTEEGKRVLPSAACSRCSETATDLTITLPALGHDLREETTVEREATCTEAGVKVTTTTCARCDLAPQRKTEEIPAKGHTYGEETETVTKAPTCTEKGSKTVTKACTVAGCDGKEERVEELAPLAHAFGPWTTTKEPTEEEAGSRERVCASCGEKETEAIPALGGSAGPDDPGDTDPDDTDPDDTDPDKPDDGKGGYTVSFDLNYTGAGDPPAALTTGEDGKLASLPASPVRSGYAFAGWYTAASGGERVDAGHVFTADATVFARWTENSGSGGARYSVYTPERVSGGTFNVYPTRAAEGVRVTIVLSPRSSYELDRLSVTDLNTGRELRLTEYYADEYVFTMPDSDVEVEITYSRRGSGGAYSFPIDTASAPAPRSGWLYEGGRLSAADGAQVYDRDPLTRDMLLSILYNLEGGGADGAQAWATNSGILPDIYESGLYGPDKSLTREQAALLLYNYARYKGYSTSRRAGLAGYRDYDRIRPAARDAMSWACAMGIINGTSADTLSPAGGLTCGQAAILLSRFETNAAYRR